MDAQQPVYVALGSSSTHGVGASRPEQTSYVAVLERFLARELPGLQRVPANGWGTGLEDFAEHWPAVEAHAPSLVTALPFSDFARTPMPEFQRRCAALFGRVAPYAAQRPGFRLFFGDLRIDPAHLRRPDAEGPGYKPEDFAMLTEKNAALAAAVTPFPWVQIVPIVDQNAVHPEWIGPGGHPNDLGHGYLAGCFRTQIEAWLRAAG